MATFPNKRHSAAKLLNVVGRTMPRRRLWQFNQIVGVLILTIARMMRGFPGSAMGM
ncbi:MAG TPA: hypothetical protein VLD55_09775 [Candidatus Sulfobium mesophilum]|nr:hypothetical protein [Candidatus Sulfobium mesophilum]